MTGRSKRRSAARWAAGAAILVYGVCGTGAWTALSALARPAPNAVPEGSFPCEFHNCGCETAEQCRTDCCCFPARTRGAPSCCGGGSTGGTKPGGECLRGPKIHPIPCRGDLPAAAAPESLVGLHRTCIAAPGALPGIVGTVLPPQDGPLADEPPAPPDKVPIANFLLHSLRNRA